ncbi:MAG: helix-turn-helix transcriptional regulator [Paludibacteraceae bacterium]|nr:helix-turn-helix transcriptional regulator [Paludibacteraceae bacterium]MBN2786928.1 helix-turn-helix transcriptional regulator [Paludibacteraceae bacterium]
MENNIKNRIQKIMELEQLNPASFAKAIQVNPSAISHILNERNKPSTEIIIKILNTFRLLSSDWLILGIGSMYRNEKISPATVQPPSLFDTTTDILETTTELSEVKEPSVSISTIKPIESLPEQSASKEETVLKPSKSLQKIIVYYSDNSFEEFISSN